MITVGIEDNFDPHLAPDPLVGQVVYEVVQMLIAGQSG